MLDYLVRVPGSHPLGFSRVVPGAAWEIGTWLPVGLLVVAVGAVLYARAQAPARAFALSAVATLVGVGVGEQLIEPDDGQCNQCTQSTGHQPAAQLHARCGRPCPRLGGDLWFYLGRG